MYKRLMIAAVLFVCLGLEAAPHKLKNTEVRISVEEMFHYHVEYKEFSPLLVRRSAKVYIEQFDPYKTYLLQSEVAPFYEISDKQASEVMAKYHADDLSFYGEINKVIQRGIERARTIRHEVENELISSDAESSEVQSESYANYAKSPAEIKARIKKQLTMVLASEKKNQRSVAWTPERKEKVFALWEKRFARSENTYLVPSGKAGDTKNELAQHYLALHTLKSLAKSMDAHTSFFSPEEAFEMRASLEKQFEGIGVVLREGVDGVVISSLVKGGPAERSGKISVGDILVEINGRSIDGATYDEILNRLKGEKGGKVVIGVRKADDPSAKPIRVELTREKIVMQDDRLQYSYEPYGSGIIGKLVLPSFYESGGSSSCEKDIREAIKNLRKNGDLLGLVIDMRSNSGGFLNQAVKVAGLFISSGVIVISKYSKGEMQYLRDINGLIYYDGPLVLLTSKASASAAEIVAQALQDYGTAIIAGDERTYGKGTIQYQTVTDDEAETFFKVTVGRYYTVSGRSTQIEGVKADLVVPTEYAPYNIGERYLAYPLKNDQVSPAYVDPLSDIDQKNKVWFQKNYLPNLQKKLSVWTQMLPQLKTNSTQRMNRDKNFKIFLRSLQLDTPDDVTTLEDKKSAKENYGVEDLQMAEAVHIVKDMIYIKSELPSPATVQK